MKQLILTQFPWPWLPSMALLIFFIFFVGLITIVTLRSRAGVYVQPSHLPLEEGTKDEGGLRHG